MILDLNDRGVAFRDIAVLVRSRAVYAKLVDQFVAFDIPVQSAGRTGLFDQPEARVLGRTVCWLTGQDWGDPYGPPAHIKKVMLLDEDEQAFALTGAGRRRLARVLEEW